MSRDEVLARLRAHRADLEAMNVTSIALFGSVARGEAGSDSDVDVLIETGWGVSYFDLVHIEDALQNILGSDVDLVTRGELHPALKDRILGEAVYAWP
jgi:predicted nucleotidyltransferase